MAIRIREGFNRSRRRMLAWLEEEAEYGRAFLFAPVFMGCGAIAWFVADADPRWTAMLLSGGVLCIGLAICGRGRPVAFRILAALMLFMGGMLSAAHEAATSTTVVLDTPVTTTLTGKVVRRELDGRGRWRYVVDIRATAKPEIKRPPQRARLIVRNQPQPFALGQLVEGAARLSPPAGPALPGLHDFAFSSYFDEIGANGFFYGRPMLLNGGALEPPATLGDRLDLGLAALREDIGDRIRAILPGDAGAFAASLVNDERRAISEETTEALRVSGLAHIVAISGLNMALSAGILFLGLRKLMSLFPGVAQALPVKKIAAFGALVTLTAYYMISGFGVSAERAFIMMAIMLVAVLFDRPSISLRNVALSALIVLILSPSEILGPSFQMSYAATMALVSGYSLWKRRRAGGPSALAAKMPFLVKLGAKYALAIATTSIIGCAATAIFSIAHFNQMATYGLIANLASEPLVSMVIMPMGMVAMLLMPFGLDAWAWHIVGWGLEIVIWIARTVAAWQGDIVFGRLESWVFPTVVAAFLLMTLLRTPLRHIGTAMMGVAILAAWLTAVRPDQKVLIAEDGTLVGLLRNGRLETNRSRPPSFIFEQWQKALATFDVKKPAMIEDASKPVAAGKGEARRRLTPEEIAEGRAAMERALESAGNEGFACNRQIWCVAMLDNGRILATAAAPYVGPACDIADIVVTPARLRFDTCRSGAPIYTAANLRRTGAMELDVKENGLAPRKSFTSINRPWSRHRAYDWRSNRFVEAQTDISDNAE